jgi:hypothetical protein
MKWHAKIGTFTARKCCFCEYWMGPRAIPIPNSNGMFQYEAHDHGICRHSLYRSKNMTAGGSCGRFKLYTHLH